MIDIPGRCPVFPLSGAVLYPRGQLPLNIFEPRYLEMVDYALSTGRHIAMMQPQMPQNEEAAKLDQGTQPLHQVGCLGRLVTFSEQGDNRYYIVLIGITRFRLVDEVITGKAFREIHIDTDEFDADLSPPFDEEDISRMALIEQGLAYFKHNGLRTDWPNLDNVGNEMLVNSMSVLTPFDPLEKQALLEAKTLSERADMLSALYQIGSDSDIAVDKKTRPLQ